MTTAGAAIPVRNNTSPNQLMGGPAIPIHVLTSGAVEAGAAIQVYELTAAELAERGITGGEPLRASLAPARQTAGGPVIPVYVVSGTLGGGGTPVVVVSELLEIFFGDADMTVQGNQTQGREEYFGGIIA